MGRAPRIIEIAEAASTNDEVRVRAAAGEPPPFWVRADRQTAGRGRRGRSWIGLDGNLFISGLYRLSASPGEAAQLSFAAALAVGDVLDGFVDAGRVRFKWPNDVLLDGAKIAGVLLEVGTAPRGIDLVIGVGVNLTGAPALPHGAAAPSTALAAALDGAPPPSAADAGRRLVEAFERWRTRWAEEDFAPLRTAWRARAAGFGERVTVRAGPGAAGDKATGDVAGVFEDLDADGALVLSTPDGRRRIHSGDVFFGGHEGVG